MLPASESHDQVKKYKFIKAFILAVREQRKVKEEDLRTSAAPELSCEAYGEWFNLVYRQLVYTKEGYGCWNELRDQKVLEETENFCKHEISKLKGKKGAELEHLVSKYLNRLKE